MCVCVFTERAGLFVAGFIVDGVSSTGLPVVLRLRVGTRPLTAHEPAATGLGARRPLAPATPASRYCTHRCVLFLLIKVNKIIHSYSSLKMRHGTLTRAECVVARSGLQGGAAAASATFSRRRVVAETDASDVAFTTGGRAG